MPETTLPQVGQQNDISDFLKGTLTSSNEGAFTIPKETMQKFNNLLSEYSIIRNLASITKISSDSIEILGDKNTSECGWVCETDERKNTDAPIFTQQRIIVHEMYAKPKVSQKLIEDSAIDIDSWIIRKIAEKMAALENNAFIHGNGENQPFGIFHYANKDEIKVIEGSNVDVFLDAQDAIKTDYIGNSVWLMSRKALSYVKHLKDLATGQFLWQPKLSESYPSTLLGSPVFVCDQLDTYPIIFGSFYDGYQIVDRLDMTIVRDPYTNKPYVEFYARKRTGGDVINKDAFVVIKEI